MICGGSASDFSKTENISLLPDTFSLQLPMNANAFVSFLLLLSVQSRRRSFQPSSWRARLEAFTFSSCLRIWCLYKFAFRIITGQGAIARLCQCGLRSQSLRIDDEKIEFESREVRNVLWRIGCLLLIAFIKISRCRISTLNSVDGRICHNNRRFLRKMRNRWRCE